MRYDFSSVFLQKSKRFPKYLKITNHHRKSPSLPGEGISENLKFPIAKTVVSEVGFFRT